MIDWLDAGGGIFPILFSRAEIQFWRNLLHIEKHHINYRVGEIVARSVECSIYKWHGIMSAGQVLLYPDALIRHFGFRIERLNILDGDICPSILPGKPADKSLSNDPGTGDPGPRIPPVGSSAVPKIGTRTETMIVMIVNKRAILITFLS